MCDYLRLRPITEADTDNIVRWRNLESVKRNLYTREPVTRESHLQWLHGQVNTGRCIQYILESPEGDIGIAFIKNIDNFHKKGEYGIFIGEESARGKGYGRRATELMLQKAFEELGLNRVSLHVFEENLPGIRAYEHAGFKIEGVLRNDFRYENEYLNAVVMGITRKMWLALQR